MAQKIIDLHEIPHLNTGKMPRRLFYTLQDAACILECKPHDILHYAFLNQLEITASARSVGVECIAFTDDICNGESAEEIDNMVPANLDLIVLPSYAALALELTGHASMFIADYGYQLDDSSRIHVYTRRERIGRHPDYRFFKLGTDWDQHAEETEATISLKDIYVTVFALSRFINKEMEPYLPPAQQSGTKIADMGREKKPHGNIRRHAAKRESILAAAIYCLRTWPEQASKSNRDLARFIDEKAPLFWPETGQPPLSLDMIERQLGATMKHPDLSAPDIPAIKREALGFGAA